jgi:membrane protein YqaA with SNARE-associated domain
MNLLKSLYNWVLAWAEHPYAVPALFILAFLESSFFPIPPDVLLIAMALSKPALSLKYAAVCTAGSVSGGLLGYLIGFAFWQLLGPYFFDYVPGFTPELFAQICQKYEENSYLIIFTAAFTPVPYKVFTVTAGVSKISLLPFTIASVIGRGGRFFLVGIVLRKFGPTAKVYLEKYLNVLTLLLVVIYIIAFYVIPKLL